MTTAVRILELPNSEPELKPQDSLSILEFAELFGFTPAELITAIERNRHACKRPFYSIQDLAARWRCSRATVYNVLREAEFKLLDLSLLKREGKEDTATESPREQADKGKRLVPWSVVEQIEKKRMRSLVEMAA